MAFFKYKALRLFPVLLCLSLGSSAKTNSIIAGFRIESSSNSHFSFIATATSSLTPLTYYWDLGDGDIIGWGSADIVNHTYAVSGTYLIKLVVRNSSGEKDSIIRSVRANVYPGSAIADFSFSPSTIFAGTQVQFANTTTNASGSSAARGWDFGDGNYTNNIENPVHIYANPGVYTISLTASNDTTVKSIRVLPAGITAGFSFTASPLCRYIPVQFTDHSVSSNGPIVSWRWRFNNGQSSTAQNPSHIFYDTGTYNVVLIAMDNLGLLDTSVQAVHIGPLANADFTTHPEIIYAGDSVQLIENAVPICTPIDYWSWSVRGPMNNISFYWSNNRQTPPKLLFPLPGNYEVMLHANDTMVKIIPVYSGGKKAACPNGSIIMNTTVTGTAFQWQVSNDSGTTWQNLQDDNIHFAGVLTGTLTISGALSSWYGNYFRCITDSIPATRFKLEFVNQYTGNGAWEDAANWSCQSLPDANTDVIITNGTVTVNTNTTCRSLKVLPGASIVVAPGVDLTVLH